MSFASRIAAQAGSYWVEFGDYRGENKSKAEAIREAMEAAGQTEGVPCVHDESGHVGDVVKEDKNYIYVDTRDHITSLGDL